MTDLYKAVANDDLRHPTGYLRQVGIALVSREGGSRWIGALHCAWDSKQEAKHPTREEARNCYYQGGRGGAPPNIATKLRGIDEDGAEETYRGDGQQPDSAVCYPFGLVLLFRLRSCCPNQYPRTVPAIAVIGATY